MEKFLRSGNTSDQRKDFTWKGTWKICSLLLIMLTAFLGMSISSQAEEDDEEEYAFIDLYGYADYEDSLAMLDLINEKRAAQNLNSLEMDADLWDCAMYRASELAVYYGDTRPDGTDHSAIWEEWEIECKVKGENIAAGYGSVESVMEYWMSSDDSKNRILGSDYTRAGIGIFIHEDVAYWVQMFADGTVTAPEYDDYGELEESEALLLAVPSVIGKASLEVELEQKVGKKGEVIVHITNAGWKAGEGEEPLYFTPVSDCLVYESSNPSVVAVDEEGTLKAVGKGTATITASLADLPSVSASQKVAITGKKKANMSFASDTVTKVIGSKAFTVKPEYDGDGKITYSSSDTSVAVVNKTTGKVTLKGIGTAEITATASQTSTYASTADAYTLKVIPAAPKLEKATSPSYTSVKITWSESKGADGYIIYQKVDGTWKRKAVVKSATSYTQNGLVCGQEYSFTVKAYKKIDGETYYSRYDKNGIAKKPALAKPKLTGLSQNSSTSTTLSWKKVDGATGYIVYRKNAAGKWDRLGVVKSNASAKYTDTGLKKGKTYTYTVKAYRSADGIKSYSSYDKNGKSITLK